MDRDEGAGGVRILVVDDEAPLTKALCDILNEHGFEASGFTSPSEALTAVAAGAYEILLADLMMPDLDGISLLKAAHAVDPDLAGIIMTGQGAIETAVEAMKSGAMDYIQKPFKASTALPVITRSLETRRMRREIAELRRIERDHMAELESRNRELAAFSSAAAHDLRSPLRAINGFAAILREDYGDQLGEEGVESLDRILSAARKMSTLIDDLLALARVSDAPARLELLSLSDLAGAIADEMSKSEPSRPIRLEIEPGLTAMADRNLMSIALQNLIGNAWKFTAKEPAPVIWIGRDLNDERQPFYVKDNGAGFASEFAGRVFEPFERFHAESDFPGTGIGLTTVRRILERHKGQAWAESEIDKGATFFFTLP